MGSVLNGALAARRYWQRWSQHRTPVPNALRLPEAERCLARSHYPGIPCK